MIAGMAGIGTFARTHINDSKMAMALEVVASSTLPLPLESQNVLCYAKIQSTVKCPVKHGLSISCLKLDVT